MAIYNAVPPPPASPPPTNTAATGASHQHTPSAASTIDIEAWTVSALEALSVSPVARGTGGTPLSIPIDGTAGASAANATTPRTARLVISANHPAAGMTPPARPLSRRDSQKKREAVLKGKEGSRQRRRWENDRLLHVPNVQPPLPTDFEVRPTHPVHHVPYHVAQYWDRGLRQHAEEARSAAALARKRAAGVRRVAPGVEVGRVPRELRATAKKTPALRSWVRVLEEPVRQFLEEARRLEGAEEAEEMDSEDEEIVFVGRNGSMRDGWKKARREVHQRKVDEGVVFDSADAGESGAFKRYLTHSISGYYGLDSRSATIGTPPRRVVYVGIKEAKTTSPQLQAELPPPMWELF